MSATLLSQVTFSSDPDVCSYQHDKFPPGRKIGTSSASRVDRTNLSNYGYHQAGINTHREVMSEKDSSKHGEGYIYLRLPRLSLDKPLPQRKVATCSYVHTHKTYLEMKGFDLNHVYSLKRNRMYVDVNDSRKPAAINTELTILPKTDMTIMGLLKSTQSAEERASSRKDSGRVWRPDESRKPNIEYASSHIMKGIDKETKVCGQRRIGYLSSKRLGKIMTRTHLRSLLASEEPGVQNTHYMKFTDNCDK